MQINYYFLSKEFNLVSHSNLMQQHKSHFSNLPNLFLFMFIKGLEAICLQHTEYLFFIFHFCFNLSS